jgi:hypothetical protein
MVVLIVFMSERHLVLMSGWPVQRRLQKGRNSAVGTQNYGYARYIIRTVSRMIIYSNGSHLLGHGDFLVRSLFHRPPKFQEVRRICPWTFNFQGSDSWIIFGFCPSPRDLKSVDKTLLGLIKNPHQKVHFLFFNKNKGALFL